MNSRTCTTLSRTLPQSGRTLPKSASAFPLRGSAAAVLAFLISGCGSSAPVPREQQDATLVQLQQPGENGEGSISFHYSNKSTDANLSIDLGNTDLYMEMSGEPPKLANGEPAVAEEKRPPPRASKPQAREQEEPDEPEPPRTAMRKKAEAKPKPEAEPAKQEPEAKQELQLPEEEQGNFEDVTSRVLAGIRKAQELFYQKRYPEAMQAVKSSLDARPTAEGYALAGSIHYMMGQGGMARRQWMEALRLNPDMPSVVNMLEKTRTPGGRGSPSPRPLLPRPAQRAAPAALPEAERPPFPEVYNEPAYNYPASAPAPAAVPAPQTPVSEPAVAEAEAESAAAPAVPVAPSAPAAPAGPAKAAPAHAAPAKASAPEPHAPEAHAETAKPADSTPEKPVKTRLPSAKAVNAAKEGKAK